MLAYELLISPTEVGRWWNRTGEEIDLVAIDDRTSDILFVEIKWTNKKVTQGLIEDLKRKSELVQWRREKRNEHFLIISKTGFTRGFLDASKEDNLSHWNFSEMKKKLTG